MQPEERGWEFTTSGTKLLKVSARVKPLDHGEDGAKRWLLNCIMQKGLDAL